MKQSKIWVWLLVLSLGALLMLGAGVRDVAREALYPYANACLWFERTVGVRAQALFSRARYASRNAMLERDVARLRIEAAEAEALEAEVARLRGILEFTPPAQGQWLAAPVLSRVELCASLKNAVRNSDVVMEAASENLALKRAIFAEASETAPPDALLGSNTSSIPITEIGRELPESARRRLVGIHWWFPPVLIPLFAHCVSAQ